LGLTGLQRAFGINRSNSNEEISGFAEPSFKDLAKEAVSTLYDFPIVEDDISSEEESTSPLSLSHKQVELNLDPIPLDDFLDIEIIDDAALGVVDSPIKLVPIDMDPKPKYSKQPSKLVAPVYVRRSLRFNKDFFA